jgi:tetratricopeptide (TPR) repeat protein
MSCLWTDHRKCAPATFNEPGRYPRPFVAACWAFCHYVTYLLIVATGCVSGNPADLKAESIRRGDELIGKKQYAQAALAYRTASDVDPRDGNVRLKLANAYVGGEDWTPALTEAVIAADLLTDDIDAQLLAAGLLLGPGRFTEAAHRAAGILRRQPENVNALLIWGNANAHLSSPAVALGKLDEAIRLGRDYEAVFHQLRPPFRSPPPDDKTAEAAFRKAVQLEPTNLNTQIALANFLWAAGRPDEGEEPLNRAARDSSHWFPNRVLGTFYLSRQRNGEGEKHLRVAVAAGNREAGLFLADYYARSNRDNDALSLLDSMTDQDDVSGEVSLRIAPLQFRLGRREEAQRRVDALLTREPRNVRALIMKAQFLSVTGEPDRSVEVARRAVAEDPLSGDARATLGQALSAVGDIENAAKELAEAVRLKPGGGRAELELARLSLALERGEQAVQFAKEAVRQFPNDRDARIVLASALVRTRDYSAADQQLNSLLSRDPHSADVLVVLGTLHAARGNDDDARAAFTRARQSDKNSFDALSGSVLLDLKHGNTASARRLVVDAESAHSKNPQYLLLAAQVFAAGNDAARAELLLRRAREIDHDNVKVSVALADLLVRQHRSDEARRLLEQIVERKPRSLDAQTSLAMLLEAIGRTTEAQAHYEKIVAQNARAGVAAYRLAKLYIDHDEKLDVALGLAVKAKQELPNDPAASNVLGLAYTRKNRTALALPHLLDAVRGSPDNAIYRYHLGSAYWSKGDLPKARAEFTRALEIDRNFAGAAQARAALASIEK